MQLDQHEKFGPATIESKAPSPVTRTTRPLRPGWDPRASWTAFLCVAGVLLVVVFTVLDPGPSRGLGFVARLGFWTVHVMVPLAILQTAQIVLSRVRAVRHLPDWAQIALSGVAGAALFAPVALAFDQVFDVAESEAGAPLVQQLVSEFAAFLPAMLLVWGGLNASRLLRLDAVPRRAPPPTEAAPDPAAEFWQRLPRTLGRDVVALTAELHYLRVHTTQGDTLILYAFGRAVEELGARGHRIHRSHWVADRHVDLVERDGDRYTVRTDTGLSLPLSRTYRRQMRDLCATRAV